MGDANIKGKPHPLDPLRPEEISQVSDLQETPTIQTTSVICIVDTIQAAGIVRDSNQSKEIFYRAISLVEPSKTELVKFLDSEHAGNRDAVHPARQARVQAYIAKTLHEMIVNLDTATVASTTPLPGRHSFIDTDFMAQVAAACLADEKIQCEISALKLPEGATVVVEPWAYATDGMRDMRDRWTMVRLPHVPPVETS